MRFYRVFSFVFALMLVLTLSVNPFLSAQAAGPSLIRDAEVESVLRDFSTPIFEAAGLHPQSIRIFIVHDPAVNAFVAGGQNIFFHTGLLTKAKRADEVIGVIAHEVGHISGGHLARTQDQLDKLSTPQILTYVLGTTTALLLGSPEVGFAILTGGAQLTLQNFLQYTRTQERAADAAAVTILERLKLSPEGLYDFLNSLSISNQWREDGSPYMRTHPTDTERLHFLEKAMTQSPYRGIRSTQRQDDQLAFVRGKLAGFLTTESDLKTLSSDKNILDARYARAIGDYRQHLVDQGRLGMQALLTSYPWHPYLYDTIGQLEAMNGHEDKSFAAYQKAYQALPFNALIRLSLGNTYVNQAKKETNDAKKKDLYRSAEEHLGFAAQKEPYNALAWRSLSIAQAGLGKKGMAELSLAEIALLGNDLKQVDIHIQRAALTLKEGDEGWIKLQDLRQAQKTARDQKKSR
jgi:predicted Zn-dependent protease